MVDPRTSTRSIPRTTTVALLAGVCGTAAMTASTAVEERWRGDVGHPVNPDASDHVATAVGTVLRRQPRGDTEREVYFLAAHWGYGSAVALAWIPLRRRLSHRSTTLGLLVGCQAMAMTLFPTLGGTAPPQRWRRDVLVSSLVHHAVYAATVAAVHAGAGRLLGEVRPPSRGTGPRPPA